MAIIINEFEIVPPPDGTDRGGGNRSAEGPVSAQTVAASMLQPADVEEILRHALQRRLRVWAD